MKSPALTLQAALNKILSLSDQYPSLTIKQIFDALAGKESFILLVLFSFPFCIPIQIPGFSTPFGIIIAGLGVQIMLNQGPWIPQWVLKKQFSSKHIQVIVKKTIWGVTWTQKIIRPRWKHLILNPFFHRLTGSIILILALLLSLPLPLPASNLFSAIPIFCMALSFLEDNGLLLIIGYGLALICLGFFAVLFWLTWDSFQPFF